MPTPQIRQLSLLLVTLMTNIVGAQEEAKQWEGRAEVFAAVEKTFGNPTGATRLVPTERVWVDRKKHRVIVDGYIALQQGQLEMFACPAFTKEHESVVGLFTKAVTVHAALLAAGAETGTTTKWDPEYVAPTGSEIQIQAYWKDDKGVAHDIDARKWVRDAQTPDKHLEPNWVFAGSGFWEDPETKKRHYNAESGDLICVSNFSTATLDIPIKSTQANTGLIFVAFTENIPKQGTPIRLVLNVVNPKATTDTKALPLDVPAKSTTPGTEAKPTSESDAKPAAATPADGTGAATESQPAKPKVGSDG